jgi:hypothetical protein
VLVEKRRQWAISNPEKALLQYAKRRAKALGLSFALTADHIVIPKRCPALGLRLIRGSLAARDASPTLDRINNKKGYVPGNVIVVSHKANRIKSNASVAELQRLVRFYGGNR